MGRYAHVQEVIDDLVGVDLSVFKVATEGDSQTQLEHLLEDYLLEGEEWVDMFTQRTFTPLHSRVEVISGQGAVALVLEDAPLFDVTRIDVRYDPLSITHVFEPTGLRLQRQTGMVSIKPSFALQGAWPLGLANQYQYIFPRGFNNIVATYRTGHAVVGSNIAAATIAEAGWYDVATITTDASYAYFTTPRPFSGAYPNATLATYGHNFMLKDGVDNSSTWTILNSRRLRCAIGSYSASAFYTFAYVPAAIGQAAVDIALAHTLARKGEKDYNGSSGGAVKITVPGFSEEFDGMQYSGAIRERMNHATELLRGYKKFLIT